MWLSSSGNKSISQGSDDGLATIPKLDPSVWLPSDTNRLNLYPFLFCQACTFLPCRIPSAGLSSSSESPQDSIRSPMLKLLSLLKKNFLWKLQNSVCYCSLNTLCFPHSSCKVHNIFCKNPDRWCQGSHVSTWRASCKHHRISRSRRQEIQTGDLWCTIVPVPSVARECPGWHRMLFPLPSHLSRASFNAHITATGTSRAHNREMIGKKKNANEKPNILCIPQFNQRELTCDLKPVNSPERS